MNRRPSGRRLVRMSVGLLWVSAGALQLQPFMFTRGFAEDVFGTAALSQPAPLGWAINTFARAVEAHPAAWDWAFALPELLIGLALVLITRGRLLTVACWASLGFGLGVWVLGEGAGGLLTGTAALSTGAPGAALLYAALTVVGWPSTRVLDARMVRAVWRIVWLLGAALVFVPAQWGARGLASQAAMGWMMSPGWTVRPAHDLTGRLIALAPPTAVAISLTTAALCVMIAFSARCSASWHKVFVGVGLALAIAYWVFAQGFGGISTGTATDVGSGPVLVILAALVLGLEPASRVARSPRHEANPVPGRVGLRNRRARVV